MAARLSLEIGSELYLPLLKRMDSYPYIWHQVVRANLLHSIAPHLAHIGSFAVHKEVGNISTSWTVSNIETGMTIFGYGYRVFNRRGDAIHAAWNLLSEVSEEKLSKAINACPIVAGFL